MRFSEVGILPVVGYLEVPEHARCSDIAVAQAEEILSE